MSSLERQIYIDTRREKYKSYLSDNDLRHFEDATLSSPVMNEFVFDLMLSWRTTSLVASMPVGFIDSFAEFSDGYANSVAPDSSVLQFAEVVLQKLSRKIPVLVEDRALRSTLISELVDLSAEFTEAKKAVSAKTDRDDLWDEYLKLDPFQMSVWASQQVAFVAFYNAYENFLVRVVEHVTGEKRRQMDAKQFKKCLRERFAQDIMERCWTNSEINILRLVRHALSHAGGRETKDLKNQTHRFKVIDGYLHVAATDVHWMVEVLSRAVSSIIEASVQLECLPETDPCVMRV